MASTKYQKEPGGGKDDGKGRLLRAVDAPPADREDIKEECRKRLAVLKEFAPEEMSEEQIRAEISEVLKGLGITEPTGKDKGKIMKELMPRVKGRADGALVNRLVGELLK